MNISPADYAHLLNRQGGMSETAKRRNRRIGGRAAQRSGDAFEQAIVRCAARSRVALVKLPKCGGRFIGPGKMVNEEIPCDFMGCVQGSGRAVFFDAKSSGKSGLDVVNEKLVKLHQKAFLRLGSEAGAIAGLLVSAAKAGKYLWLPGKVLLDFGGSVPWRHPAWLDMGEVGGAILWERLIQEGR